MTDQVEKTEVQEEMDSIKERLDLMGVKYHHNANLKTLKGLLDKALIGEPEEDEPKTTKLDANVERVKSEADAMKLVRCAINCNNMGKRQLKGEFVTSGNSVIGHKTVFVPYNCQEAEDYVLPMIIVSALRQRRYLAKTEDMVTDIHERTFYMAPEFTISILGDA